MARNKLTEDALIEGDTDFHGAVPPEFQAPDAPVVDFDPKTLIGKAVFYYPGAEHCGPEDHLENAGVPFGGVIAFADAKDLVTIAYVDHAGRVRRAERVVLNGSDTAPEGVAYVELVA